MAHTDACKIQVTQFVEKLTEKGMSVREACESAEKESDGIPAATIRRWWHEIKKEVQDRFKNEPVPITSSLNKQIAEKQKKQQVNEVAINTPGPRRSPKYSAKESTLEERLLSGSQAIYLANLAISQLSRIELEDPKRDEAFKRVIDWIKKQPGGKVQ